jgi:hypothetical protein
VKILLWHGYLLGGTGSNVYTRALAREWRTGGHNELVSMPATERAALGAAARRAAVERWSWSSVASRLLEPLEGG